MASWYMFFVAICFIYIAAICYISRSFVLFFPILVYYINKNLATLRDGRVLLTGEECGSEKSFFQDLENWFSIYFLQPQVRRMTRSRDKKWKSFFPRNFAPR
jgi:hypothetical protein